MKLCAELIFMWKVSHLDSLWKRGTRELGNGLLLVHVVDTIHPQSNKFAMGVENKAIGHMKLNDSPHST